MTTVLHTCCGPCASACVPRLKALGREVTMLFANSNIDTREEYEKRLHEAHKLAATDGVKLAALPYDHDEWLSEVAVGFEGEPEKGARCRRCFRYNLRKTAEFAAAHGFDEFTTSLTVSPHKVSETIFAIARELADASQGATFLYEDFKKREGFKLSVRRAAELGLYRQAYCGCEFSKWRLHHRPVTASTNLDAREGKPGDVFTADWQTKGRGRLDHVWLSSPGENLMMSVVLSVAELPPEQVATLPLVAGLAVVHGVAPFVAGAERPLLKWPNDVWVAGRKLAGILCERHEDRVIVGIGVNVGERKFDPSIADRTTSLALLSAVPVAADAIPRVRSAILVALDRLTSRWRRDGFAAVYPEVSAIDVLRGRRVSVRQTDDDPAPLDGVCGGIRLDGSLDVGGRPVFAGEAHVEEIK